MNPGLTWFFSPAPSPFLVGVGQIPMKPSLHWLPAASGLRGRRGRGQWSICDAGPCIRTSVPRIPLPHRFPASPGSPGSRHEIVKKSSTGGWKIIRLNDYINITQCFFVGDINHLQQRFEADVQNPQAKGHLPTPDPSFSESSVQTCMIDLFGSVNPSQKYESRLGAYYPYIFVYIYMCMFTSILYTYTYIHKFI